MSNYNSAKECCGPFSSKHWKVTCQIPSKLFLARDLDAGLILVSRYSQQLQVSQLSHALQFLVWSKELLNFLFFFYTGSKHQISCTPITEDPMVPCTTQCYVSLSIDNSFLIPNSEVKPGTVFSLSPVTLSQLIHFWGKFPEKRNPSRKIVVWRMCFDGLRQRILYCFCITRRLQSSNINQGQQERASVHDAASLPFDRKGTITKFPACGACWRDTNINGCMINPDLGLVVAQYLFFPFRSNEWLFHVEWGVQCWVLVACQGCLSAEMSSAVSEGLERKEMSRADNDLASFACKNCTFCWSMKLSLPTSTRSTITSTSPL